MGATFFIDLKESHDREKKLEQRFQEQGLLTSNTSTLECFPGYDIQTWVSGTTTGTTKYEVKYDYRSSSTGNVAVEAYKWNNGKKVKSGITASSADNYVYSFPDDDNFYSIKKIDLWNMILRKEYIRVVNGGDDGRFSLCLFNKEFFLSRCSII